MASDREREGQSVCTHKTSHHETTYHMHLPICCVLLAKLLRDFKDKMLLKKHNAALREDDERVGASGSTEKHVLAFVQLMI